MDTTNTSPAHVYVFMYMYSCICLECYQKMSSFYILNVYTSTYRHTTLYMNVHTFSKIHFLVLFKPKNFAPQFLAEFYEKE